MPRNDGRWTVQVPVSVVVVHEALLTISGEGPLPSCFRNNPVSVHHDSTCLTVNAFYLHLSELSPHSLGEEI